MDQILVLCLLSIWVLAPAKTLSQQPISLNDRGGEDGEDGGDAGNGGGDIGGGGSGGGGGDDQQGCVSGEMQIDEQTKGVVRVSQLSEGDVILGVNGPERKPAWCKVLAVFPASGGKNLTTHEGFTADHFVFNHTVHPHGYKGVVREEPVFTLFTDCDASQNAVGKIFTPISTAFCPHELSWSEYLSLIAAIRRVTTRTGKFWFDMAAYHDNETAIVPHWFDQLHQICHELLLCASENRCQRFEEVMAEFVHEHLNKEYVEIVDRAFPNMGGDVNKQQAGTITEVVCSKESSHTILLSTLGSAMVVLLIVAIFVLVYRTRMMKKGEKLQPNNGDVKA